MWRHKECHYAELHCASLLVYLFIFLWKQESKRNIHPALSLLCNQTTSFYFIIIICIIAFGIIFII